MVRGMCICHKIAYETLWVESNIVVNSIKSKKTKARPNVLIANDDIKHT